MLIFPHIPQYTAPKEFLNLEHDSNNLAGGPYIKGRKLEPYINNL